MTGLSSDQPGDVAPSRARELKSDSSGEGCCRDAVAPSRARELKLTEEALFPPVRTVAPSRARELKSDFRKEPPSEWESRPHGRVS